MHLRKMFLLMIVTSMLLIGCGSSDSASNSNTPMAGSQTPQTAVITPYTTRTPVIPPTATTQTEPTPTPPPRPTPTPYMYTVVTNDTMIGIASYFGITLDELMVANPDVSPNALSIGTQLIIPLELEDSGEDTGSETQAELVLDTAEVLCYPIRSGGAWCYWPVTNPYEQPVENLTGTINLYDERNQLVASQPAMSLLNVLPAGASAPLVSYFPPPLAQYAQIQGQLTGAITANQYNSRYLTTSIEQFTITPINPDNQGILVSGALRYALPEGENPAAPAAAWLVAVATDINGDVVGVRRWEAEEIPIEGSLNFSFEIFSLGKPIEQVELLAEVPAP